MLADNTPTPLNEPLAPASPSFEHDGIEAELAFLLGALEQAEGLETAGLGDVDFVADAMLASAPRDRYRVAGPAMVKVAAIGLATFPTALAPVPAFANEPLPQNMMLAMARRPDAAPALAATGAQLFPFSRPMLALRSEVKPAAHAPAPHAPVATSKKRFSLNPRLKTLFLETRHVAVTTKRGPAATFYQVGRGDSLYSIAADLLGSGARWRELYQANKATVSASYALRPGQRLVIPSHRSASPVHMAGAPKAMPHNSPRVGQKGNYRVTPGDSLYTIAQKRLGNGERWREIVAMNKAALQGRTLIYPNQWLQLPSGHQG